MEGYTTSQDIEDERGNWVTEDCRDSGRIVMSSTTGWLMSSWEFIKSSEFLYYSLVATGRYQGRAVT